MSTTEQIANDREIVQTIIAQLGGAGRLVAMLGAKHLMSDGPALSFRFGARAVNKANHVKIALAADDTYTITWHRIRGFDAKEIGETTGIDVANLRATFERTTELRLSL